MNNTFAIHNSWANCTYRMILPPPFAKRCLRLTDADWPLLACINKNLPQNECLQCLVPPTLGAMLVAKTPQTHHAHTQNPHTLAPSHPDGKR